MNPVRCGIIGLAGLLAASIAAPTLAQSVTEAACSNAGGQFDAVSAECHYASMLEIDIQLPLEFADRPFVAQTLNSAIGEARTAFVQEYANTFADPDLPQYAANYSLSLDYTTETRADGLLNVVYTMYFYTGGAHGNTTYQTYLFDVAHDRVLTLADVLPDTQAALEAIAPLAQASLAEQLADAADTTWIAEGTAPDAVNYRHFILGDESITFLFDPYQVAPYAAGAPQVEIPLSEIASFLSPDLG